MSKKSNDISIHLIFVILIRLLYTIVNRRSIARAIESVKWAINYRHSRKFDNRVLFFDTYRERDARLFNNYYYKKIDAENQDSRWIYFRISIIDIYSRPSCQLIIARHFRHDISCAPIDSRYLLLLLSRYSPSFATLETRTSAMSFLSDIYSRCFWKSRMNERHSTAYVKMLYIRDACRNRHLISSRRVRFIRQVGYCFFFFCRISRFAIHAFDEGLRYPRVVGSRNKISPRLNLDPGILFPR